MLITREACYNNNTIIQPLFWPHLKLKMPRTKISGMAKIVSNTKGTLLKILIIFMQASNFYVLDTDI